LQNERKKFLSDLGTKKVLYDITVKVVLNLRISTQVTTSANTTRACFLKQPSVTMVRFEIHGVKP